MITSGYSFIPIDWAQYLGGEPLTTAPAAFYSHLATQLASS